MRLEYNQSVREYLRDKIIDPSIPPGEREYIAVEMCRAIKRLHMQCNENTKLQQVARQPHYEYTLTGDVDFNKIKRLKIRAPGIIAMWARVICKYLPSKKRERLGWWTPFEPATPQRRTIQMEKVELKLGYHFMEQRVMVLLGYIPDTDTLLIASL